MKELLSVLFYQAIVTVNTAVILSGIILLAKRKEEKDERKPNPDFTPPPEKKPEVELRSALIKTVNGEKIAQRWYSPDEQIPQYAILQGEPYKFLAEMDKDGGKLVEFVRIKPPTTGTNAITPKDGEKCRRPYMTTAIVRGENGKLTIPIAETGVPVAGFGWRGEDRIFGYVQTLGRTTTPDTGAPWDIDPETGEVKDYQAVNGKEYRVYYWTKKEDAQCIRTPPITGGFFMAEVRGGLGNQVIGTVVANNEEELEKKLREVKAIADEVDRTYKKPVTLERMKEAGFETEKVRVFDPAEKRWTYREVVKNSKCSDCKHWKKETCSSVGRCEVLDRPTKWYERGCQLFDKWEPPIQTTHICKNCKHYLTTEEGAATGLCGMMEEVVFGNSYRACFEKREKE